MVKKLWLMQCSLPLVIILSLLKFSLIFKLPAKHSQKLYMIVSSVIGRAPNSKRLNLEAVGVELDKSGAIKVSSNLLNVLGILPHITSLPSNLKYEKRWREG